MRSLEQVSYLVPFGEELAGGPLIRSFGNGSGGSEPKGAVAFLNPWQEVPSWVPERSFPVPEWDHAAPLSPIRDRDLQEMKEMFDREDMLALESEVDRMLSLLFPAPLWDESGWATLGEFGDFL
ncbi:MAG: hypothetical protein HC860_26810 [Alkalinema sp. RU_4_3]|nr:hypothetical protein [Alkalinema sp. RU_4_3]